MKIVFINGSPKTSENNSGYFISEMERMIQETKKSLEIEINHVRINRPKIDSAEKEQIISSDIIVFCFPLYADAIPSHLLRVIVELESSFQNHKLRRRTAEFVGSVKEIDLGFDTFQNATEPRTRERAEGIKPSPTNQPKKPIVYAVVNCGFFEGKQNHIALDIVRNWCYRAGLAWKQGMGIGGGEMQGQGLVSIPCGYGPKKDLGKMMQTFVENILHQTSGSNLFANPNFPRFAFIFMGHLSWYQMAKKNGVRRKDIFLQP